jgi:integrase
MIRFYLREKTATGFTSVLMTVFYENNRMKISTGCKVPPNMWNSKKQRVKVSIDFENANEINDRLDDIEAVMESLLKKYRDEDYFPGPEQMKQDFLKQRNVPLKHRKAKTFWDHFEDFIGQKKLVKPDMRDYNNSLRKHLHKIEEIMGTNLSFALISSDSGIFAEEWSNYLSYVALNSEGEPGLLPNTIGKQNKNLKSFLNWCFDKNIISKFSLKGFPTLMEDVDKIYLTENDLEQLEALTPQEGTQTIVCDLFLVGCETGLRFSDFTRIQPHFLRNGKLYITPKKTRGSGGKNLVIPISARFQRVLDKYHGVLPNFDRNGVTRFNSTIRELCAQAGMTDKIIFNREVAGQSLLITKHKYEEVSSHTCRRTFCTLKFLKGMPAQAIMKFSGHQTERNFLKYLKLDAELTAQKYGEFF